MEEKPNARHGGLHEANVSHLSCLDLHSSADALQLLLQSPVRFVPATKRTIEDESSMAPKLRPQHVCPDPFESEVQRQKGVEVSLEARLKTGILTSGDTRYLFAMENTVGWPKPLSGIPKSACGMLS